MERIFEQPVILGLCSIDGFIVTEHATDDAWLVPKPLQALGTEFILIAMLEDLVNTANGSLHGISFLVGHSHEDCIQLLNFTSFWIGILGIFKCKIKVLEPFLIFHSSGKQTLEEFDVNFRNFLFEILLERLGAILLGKRLLEGILGTERFLFSLFSHVIFSMCE